MPYAAIPTRDTNSGVPIGTDINQFQTNLNDIVNGNPATTTAPVTSLLELNDLIAAETAIHDGTIKVSGGTYAWTGSAPTFSVTITAAQHGLSLTNASDFSAVFWTEDGTDIELARVSKVTVNKTTKDITVENSVNDDINFHFRK